jgi:ABC-2 type transport system ATP-binding protein
LMQQEVLRVVREERERGTTVFFSSHILSEVQKVADRVGIIRKGKLVETAQMDELINHALSRLTVQFGEPVPATGFDSLPEVKILRVNDGQRSYTLEVRGEMDRLIKALAGYPVRDMSVQKPSLEEVFLNYYRNKGEEE